MKRVTLDTNRYVSALDLGGKPLQLLQTALKAISKSRSQPIIDETLRVLEQKFGWVEADPPFHASTAGHCSFPTKRAVLAFLEDLEAAGVDQSKARP